MSNSNQPGECLSPGQTTYEETEAGRIMRKEIMRQVEESDRRINELRSKHEHATNTIAEMYEAATGKLKTPTCGVVEDVAAVRAELLMQIDELFKERERSVLLQAELLELRKNACTIPMSAKEPGNWVRVGPTYLDNMRDELQRVHKVSREAHDSKRTAWGEVDKLREELQDQATRYERETARDKELLRSLTDRITRLAELSISPAIMIVEQAPTYLDHNLQPTTLEELAKLAPCVCDGNGMCSTCQGPDEPCAFCGAEDGDHTVSCTLDDATKPRVRLRMTDAQLETEAVREYLDACEKCINEELANGTDTACCGGVKEQKKVIAKLSNALIYVGDALGLAPVQVVNDYDACAKNAEAVVKYHRTKVADLKNQLTESREGRSALMMKNKRLQNQVDRLESKA